MPIATNPDTGETVYLTEGGEWKPAQTAVNPQTKEMLAFDGKGWTPVPAKSKGVLGYIDDAVRSIANGVPYMAELSAKANELIGRGSYDTNLVQEKAQDAQIPPAIAIPGQIAGAVASTLAAAPVTGPLAAATGIARLPGIARAALGGAAGGALFGSSNAGPGHRLEGALTGGAEGAALGPVAYGAVKAGEAVVRGVRGAVSPEQNVTADLQRALQRDGTTPEAFLQRVEENNAARPGVAVPADAGGENVRGLVERIAQTPGAGRTTVIPNLTTRQEMQMRRISTDLAQLTGTQQTATQAIRGTMEDRAAAAKPLYDQAFSFNAREVPAITGTFDKETAGGWGSFLLKGPELRRTLQTEYGITDPANAPLMVVIDAWKKRADDVVGKAIRDGNGNMARVIGDMRDRVLENVDQYNPAYKAARNAWSGPSRYLDAIEEGRGVLNAKLSGEQLQSAVGAMSGVDQEAYRIGAITAIRDKMGNDAAKLPDMTKYLRSPAMREKIAALMPDDQARAAWAQRLNFEVGSSELTGRALGNSSTARRLAEKEDAENIVGDLIAGVFKGRPPASLLSRAVEAVPRTIRDKMRSKSDAILAELLTDPQSMAGLQKAMQRVEARNSSPQLQLAAPATINAVNSQSGRLPKPY